jgi:hypothetical protein
MSTPTQEIYHDHGTTQSITYDVPEGRPSAVTSVEVFSDTTGDDGTAEAATSGSASVESHPSTTVDATSGAGQNNPRKLSLTATTGVDVGRVYLVSGSSGEKEWGEVREVVTDDYVILRSPLHNTYVNTNTFQGTRIGITVEPTWMQDTSNISDDLSPNPGYRVRWVYVYDGLQYVKDTYFDLVRYKSGHNVTPQDMERFLPAWRNILPTYHREDNGRALIDEAYQQVKFDLYSHDRADEMIRDREAVDELVKNKARELLLFQRFFEAGTGPEMADEARTQYHSRLDSLVVRTSKVPFATDSGGAGFIIEPPSIWSR